MRLSLALVLLGFAGLLGGGWLIGRWAFGLAVVFDSLTLLGVGLVREVPDPQKPLSGLQARLEEYRRAP